MGVTTPLGKEPRPMDASVAAMDAKILRIFYENPFLEKIFAYRPPAALRGLSEGPPGGGTQGRSIPVGVTTPLENPLPMVAGPRGNIKRLQFESTIVRYRHVIPLRNAKRIRQFPILLLPSQERRLAAR